jgi:hypothetical protein
MQVRWRRPEAWRIAAEGDVAGQPLVQVAFVGEPVVSPTPRRPAAWPRSPSAPTARGSYLNLKNPVRKPATSPLVTRSLPVVDASMKGRPIKSGDMDPEALAAVGRLPR